MQKHFLQMEYQTRPTTQKINSIEHKLELLANSKLQNMAQTGIKKLEERINSLDRRFMEQSNSTNTKITQYRSILLRSEQQAGQLQQTYLEQTRIRSKRLKELKDQIKNYLTEEGNQPKEFQRRLGPMFQEKAKAIEEDIEAMRANRKRQINELTSQISDQLQSFRLNIHEEVEANNEGLQGRVISVRNASLALQQQIETAQQQRQGLLIDKLRETVSEIKQTLAIERAEREQKRDKIFDLVNNAIKFIDRSE